MATYLPLKPGCTFHPFHNGPVLQDCILRTADNRQFRISASAYEVLSALDRGRSLEQIHDDVGGENAISFGEFYQFIVTQYQPFLACDQVVQSSPNLARRRIKLLLHHTFIPEQVVVRISTLLACAYRPLVASVLLLLIGTSHFLLYLDYVPSTTPFHASLVVLVTFFSVVVHEFGHSSAVVRFGGTPGSIGAGLYILLPVLYADVSQVWAFRQKQRVIVDLGGIYFQQIVFGGIAVMAVLSHDPSLRAACISIDVMTVIAINPVFRFDGYWVLVDWLGVPNLHRKAGTYLGRMLRWLPNLRWEAPQHDVISGSRFKTAIFVIYALFGNLFLGAAILLNLHWIRRTMVGLTSTAPVLLTQVRLAFNHHELLRTIDLLTGLMFLLASGLTVIFALWLRGKEMVSVRSSNHP